MGRAQAEAASKAAAQREFDRNVRLDQLKAQTAAILAEQARHGAMPPPPRHITIAPRLPIVPGLGTVSPCHAATTC